MNALIIARQNAWAASKLALCSGSRRYLQSDLFGLRAYLCVKSNSESRRIEALIRLINCSPTVKTKAARSWDLDDVPLQICRMRWSDPSSPPFASTTSRQPYSTGWKSSRD